MLPGRLFGYLAPVLLLLLFLPQPAFSQDPDGLEAATVLAANGEARLGSSSTNLPVQVINVQKLGAATVAVSFDPTRLRAVACRRSAAFDVGFCNMTIDSDKDGKADTVEFNALSIMGVSTGGTPVALASISWVVVGPVTAPSATTLRVRVKTFTNTDSYPLESAAQDGQVTLLPPRLLLPFVSRPGGR